ncbi:MAG: SGNH/GDSL hydrolase family protein [Gemmatimonas sp.]
MRVFPYAAALVGALIVAVAALRADPTRAQEAPDPSPCAVPPALIRVDAALLRTATRLGRRPFRIVAIGSSSTEGAGATGPEASYPAVLARELSQRFPGARISVFNKGIGGERITQMMARFDRDVMELRPDLVIFQVGTNEATANDAILQFQASLIDGIQKLRARGIDIILMSPQFAPRMNVRSNHLLYVETVRAVSEREGVQLFRRFDIMDFWIASGQLAVSDLIVGDGLHMSDFAYYCTAVLLADMLETAAKAGENVIRAPTQPLLPPRRPEVTPGGR